LLAVDYAFRNRAGDRFRCDRETLNGGLAFEARKREGVKVQIGRGVNKLIVGMVVMS
jgi:hypothetical protein